VVLNLFSFRDWFISRIVIFFNKGGGKNPVAKIRLLAGREGDRTWPGDIKMPYRVVVEYWSTGVLEKAKPSDGASIRPVMTPSIHHSITPVRKQVQGRRNSKPFTVTLFD
jgi:hypothetical protein